MKINNDKKQNKIFSIFKNRCLEGPTIIPGLNVGENIVVCSKKFLEKSTYAWYLENEFEI